VTGTVRVVVLGYVNVDHVAGLTRELEPGVTAQVARWHTGPAGRLGGCASYIATGLAAARLNAAVVGAVGQDSNAEVVASGLERAGVGVSGLARGELPRTGAAWLAHAPAGASYCIYDPGGPLPESLTRPQRQLCARADWLVAAVGPPAPCAEAVTVLPRDAGLCWAVKADPVSFPASVARTLARRAQIIVYSAHEAGFLGEVLGTGWREEAARPDALVVETRGADGASFWQAGGHGRLRPDATVDVTDSTGAGDRFCAGLLAARISGAGAAAAVRSGMAAAAALLRERAGCFEEGCG